MVSDEVSGLLVASGNAEALSTALERVLENPEWANELGSRARQTVVERYSRAAIAEQTAHLYRSVCESQFSGIGRRSRRRLRDRSPEVPA